MSYLLLNSGVYVCVCMGFCACALYLCVLSCMRACVWFDISNGPEASIAAFQCFPRSYRHVPNCPKHFSNPPAPPEMGQRDIYTWFLAFVATSVKKQSGMEWWNVLFRCLLAVIKVPSCLQAYHLILKQITANANNYVQIALTQVWI